MIEKILCDRMAADPEIGFRPYPNMAPEQTEGPYITYDLLDLAEPLTADGPGGIEESLYRITVYSALTGNGRRAQVKRLAKALRRSFNFWHGPVTGGRVLRAVLDDESDGVDQHTGRYKRLLTLSISYCEEQS